MGKFVTITPEAALEIMGSESELTILDIRPKQDYDIEHIVDAINLDYNGHNFQKKVDKLDKHKSYIIYCKSGVRGGYFMEKMKESGFKGAYNILGGFVGWKVRKLPTFKL